MSISLVIPIYNTEKYIRECLDSVLNQTLKPSEIILVNDGTLDRSLEVVGDLIEANPEIKVIHQENAGLAAARNTGILHATQNYLAFLDSDDYLAPDYLEKLYESAITYDLDVVCAGNTRFYPDGTYEVMSRNPELMNEKILTGWEALLIQLKADDYNMEVVDDLYKTSFLKKNDLKFAVGLLHEDEEFTPKVLLQAKRVSFFDAHGYFYRQRENSIMSSGVSKRTVESLEEILNRYLEMFEGSDSKEALSYLLLYLGESYIDRINLSKLSDRGQFYKRLPLSELFRAMGHGAVLSKKQKLKFNALRLHYRLFELLADTQRRLKS